MTQFLLDTSTVSAVVLLEGLRRLHLERRAL